jgi:hypothetical protein
VWSAFQSEFALPLSTLLNLPLQFLRGNLFWQLQCKVFSVLHHRVADFTLVDVAHTAQNAGPAGHRPALRPRVAGASVCAERAATKGNGACAERA